MSTLSSLKLVVAKKPAKLPPVVQRRNKLLTRLWEQIELAKAVQNGTTFAPTCIRTVKDAETGLRREITRPKRIRPWWWANDNGKVCVSIKYGNKPIELVKGKSAVEVASSKDLIETLTTIKTAVEAGELDAQIEANSGAVGRKAKS